MIIATVNENDRQIGTIPRSRVFLEQKNFRTVHVWIVNDGNELLVHRISAERERHPGYWGSSVAGYLHDGEGYLDCAQRKLSQELGIPGSHPLKLIGKTRMSDNGCGKFVTLYTARHNGPFRLDRSQISEILFIPWAQVSSELSVKNFTPTFLHLWHKFFA